MERRDDDLDAVVEDDTHVLQEVLLRRKTADGRARRGPPGQLVDELVHPARRQHRAGATGEQ